MKFHSFSSLDEQKIDFKDGFDVAEALYFMQLSKLVYCDKEEIEEKLQKHYHFDSFQFFSKRSHKRFSLRLWNRLMVLSRGRKSMVDLQFVYLTHWDDSIQKTIITFVFRGSKEKKDWLTNFSVRDRPILGKGMVHQGFKEAYLHFLQMTKRERQDLRKKCKPRISIPIYFIGVVEVVFLFFLATTPVSNIALTKTSITGTETLFPINFIHLARDSGSLKSSGKP